MGDRVQVIKQEWPNLGGDAADSYPPYQLPIDPQEDNIEVAGVYVQDGSNRDENAQIWREGDNLKAKDPAHGTVNLLDGGTGGITEVEHDGFDKLLHNLDESHEIVPTLNADGVMTTVLSRQPSAGNTIRNRTSFATDADGLITGFVVTQHDGAGATVETMTASITITGGVPTLGTLTRT